MHTWVALFRGINVGGNNILKMAELKNLLQSLGCSEVKTYIQSGNVVFQSAGKKPAPLTRKIRTGVKAQYGFEPKVLLLTPSELRAAVDGNPFAKAITEPKTLHFFFLEASATQPDFASLDQAKSPSEEYELADGVFYLHAPEGIGRSKLAANAEKHLGVATTARNYRTVEKVLSMVMT